MRSAIGPKESDCGCGGPLHTAMQSTRPCGCSSGKASLLPRPPRERVAHLESRSHASSRTSRAEERHEDCSCARRADRSDHNAHDLVSRPRSDGRHAHLEARARSTPARGSLVDVPIPLDSEGGLPSRGRSTSTQPVRVISRFDIGGLANDAPTTRDVARAWARTVQQAPTTREKPRPWAGPLGTQPPERDRPGFIVKVVSSKVCQLTGDEDRGSGKPTGMVLGSGPDARGVKATDIGWSFEHEERLYFLFGDTDDFSVDRCEPVTCGTVEKPSPWRVDRRGPKFSRWDSDEAYRTHLETFGTSPECIASAPASVDPQFCIPLQVASDDGVRFRATKLNHVSLGRSEGAFSGFSDGTNMFAFFTLRTWPRGCSDPGGCGHDATEDTRDPTTGERHRRGVPGGRLALARSTDDGRNFDEIALFSAEKFQFVAPSVVHRANLPGLPSDLRGRDVVFAFGAGRVSISSAMPYPEWGESYPYLAVAALEDVAKKSAHVRAYDTIFPGSYGGGTVTDATQLAGAPVGTNVEDRWVLAQGSRIVVVRSDGLVWAHDVGPSAVGPAYHIPPRSGPWPLPRVATLPMDKWVLVHGDRLLVVTEAGEVYAHALTSHVEPARKLIGPPVGARPDDHWAAVVRNRILVITKRGQARAYPLSSSSVGPAQPLILEGDGDPIDQTQGVAGWFAPGSSPDRWVFGVDDKLVRVLGDGRVYFHRVHPTSISGARSLSPQSIRVGVSPSDRWLLAIGGPGPNRPWRLLVVSHRLTHWRYFERLDSSGAPMWSASEEDAGPLSPFGATLSDHEKSFGYFSVRFIDALRKWVMLYTSNIKHQAIPWGVYLRSAPLPWGPWSRPVPVLTFPQGFCEFIYNASPPPIDAAATGRFPTTRLIPRCWPNPSHDGNRRLDASLGAIVRNGGAYYAPFLLPSRYAKARPGGNVELYYTLSTWNPYQTVLMRAEAFVR